MAQQERGWLSQLFYQAVYKPVYKAVSWVVDKAFDFGPNVYVPSRWAEPARQYDDTPTDELMAGLERDKVIHLHELYQIAHALSFENPNYFISKKDTVAFLWDFSADLHGKAGEGRIESWCRKDFMENRRDIFYIRVGDLLDHIKENPLPGDEWQVKTLETKGMFAGPLRNRPLQLCKLMVVSALLAEDQRPAIAASPDSFYHRSAGGAAPAITPQPPAGPAYR